MPLTFGTAEELARRDEVDLVVVTVKVPHHREVVTTALQAGKMVLCEWPLGNGLAEAEEPAALARYPDGGRVASAFVRLAISVTWSPTATSRKSCRRPSSLLPRTGAGGSCTVRPLSHRRGQRSNSADDPGKCPRRRRSGARRTRRSRHDATKHGVRLRDQQ